MATAIALVMAAISIISAVVAWRAADWSAAASDHASVAVQERLEREQIEAELAATVAGDAGLVARYHEHWLAAAQLGQEADDLRATDRTAADRLELQAQVEWEVSGALVRFFRAALPAYDGQNVSFDRVAVLATLEAENDRLNELKVSRAAAAAAAAGRTTLDLIGLAGLFIVALFVLTIAEVASYAARRAFAAVGVTITLIALIGLALVDPAAGLPISLVAALGVVVIVAGVRLAPGVADWLVAAGQPTSIADLIGADTPVSQRIDVPIPDPDETRSRFANGVAVLVALTTLIGAGDGFLQAQTRLAADRESGRAQDLGVEAVGRLHRAEQDAAADVETFILAAEQRAYEQAAAQQVRYHRSVDDVESADVALADQRRWATLAAATAGLTELTVDHPDGPDQDPAFPARYRESGNREVYRLVALQDAANDLATSWGQAAAAHVAVLAIVAVALYLFGLSLILDERRLGRLFAVVATFLLAIGAGWAALTVDGYPAGNQAHAIDEAASAYASAQLAANTARGPADYPPIRAQLEAAIEAYPGFGRAHALLGNLAIGEGSPQRSGYLSVIRAEQAREGLAELLIAQDLGFDTAATRASIGFVAFVLALEEGDDRRLELAASQTRLALEVRPTSPVLRFNLGVILLADGETDAAVAAYERAIEATIALGRIDSRIRQAVVSGALTDLELLAAHRPARASDAEAIKSMLVARTGHPPGPASDVVIADLELQLLSSALQWTARIEGLDPGRDTVSAFWYRTDPGNPGWHVIDVASGPLVSGTTTLAGYFGPNANVEGGYFGNADYLPYVVPETCLPEGDYRLELYVNGILRANASTSTEFRDQSTEHPRDLGLIFCRPGSWNPGLSEPGVSVGFASPDGGQGLHAFRLVHPSETDPGRAVADAMADVAASWSTYFPGQRRIGDDPEPAEWAFMDLSSVSIRWYESNAGTVKMVGGVSDLSIVRVVALFGSSEWVDSDEANAILLSFLQR